MYFEDELREIYSQMIKDIDFEKIKNSFNMKRKEGFLYNEVGEQRISIEFSRFTENKEEYVVDQIKKQLYKNVDFDAIEFKPCGWLEDCYSVSM
jgi:predicted 3-demethylubiquinone-9 3-methyltransferase (glyoxalase superfamily)